MKTIVSNLQPGDIIRLSPALPAHTVDAVKPDETGFVKVTMYDGQGYGGTFSLPADSDIEVDWMIRTIDAPCMLCRDAYPHVADLAVSRGHRGICGPCDARTTAEVLRNRGGA